MFVDWHDVRVHVDVYIVYKKMIVINNIIIIITKNKVLILMPVSLWTNITCQLVWDQDGIMNQYGHNTIITPDYNVDRGI